MCFKTIARIAHMLENMFWLNFKTTGFKIKYFLNFLDTTLALLNTTENAIAKITKNVYPENPSLL